ncbi:MAG: hypothetical protein AAF989_12610, partial [Planctomycetota bacterium]
MTSSNNPSSGKPKPKVSKGNGNRSSGPRTGTQRAGKERIESLGLPKSRLAQWWQDGDKTDRAIRVGIVLLGVISLLALCKTWRPPFAFREGMIPARELITRVQMEVPDESRTKLAREDKRRSVLAYYRNRPEPLNQLKAALRDQLFLVLTAQSFDEMSREGRQAFAEFYEGDESDDEADEHDHQRLEHRGELLD